MISALVLAACAGQGGNPATAPISRGDSVARRIVLPHQNGRHAFDSSGKLMDRGFESGGFTYWQQCGDVNASITRAKAHSGSYSEFSGSTSAPEVNGDSGVCQEVQVPSNGNIAFWVWQGTNEVNTDYAWQEADLLDSSGNVLDNLYTTAAKTKGWVQLSYNVASYAGRTVWLYFGAHGNGWSGGYIFQYVDDVAWSGTNTPTPSPSNSPTPTPNPSNTPSPTPSPTPSTTPSPSPSPTPTAYPCNDQQFLTYQKEFGNGQLQPGDDQLVDVCGSVTQVLPAKRTSSGLHGYFYVEMPSGYDIEIVSNLDAMAQAPNHKPPSQWPWVAVGDYAYVQGRYYYDNQSSQGIDWTEDDTGPSWPHTGDVVVCNSGGTGCNFYW